MGEVCNERYRSSCTGPASRVIAVRVCWNSSESPDKTAVSPSMAAQRGWHMLAVPGCWMGPLQTLLCALGSPQDSLCGAGWPPARLVPVLDSKVCVVQLLRPQPARLLTQLMVAVLQGAQPTAEAGRQRDMLTRATLNSWHALTLGCQWLQGHVYLRQLQQLSKGRRSRQLHTAASRQRPHAQGRTSSTARAHPCQLSQAHLQGFDPAAQPLHCELVACCCCLGVCPLPLQGSLDGLQGSLVLLGGHLVHRL